MAVSAIVLPMQCDAVLVQQVQAQLGGRAPAATQAEEECLCVVCMDERKQHAMVSCMHVCVCEACALRLPRCADVALPAGVPVEAHDASVHSRWPRVLILFV